MFSVDQKSKKNRDSDFFNYIQPLIQKAKVDEYSEELENKFHPKKFSMDVIRKITELTNNKCGREIELIKNLSDSESLNKIYYGDSNARPIALPGKQEELKLVEKQFSKCQEKFKFVLVRFSYLTSLIDKFSNESINLCIDDCELKFKSGEKKESETCMSNCLNLIKMNDKASARIISESAKEVIQDLKYL